MFLPLLNALQTMIRFNFILFIFLPDSKGLGTSEVTELLNLALLCHTEAVG